MLHLVVIYHGTVPYRSVRASCGPGGHFALLPLYRAVYNRTFCFPEHFEVFFVVRGEVGSVGLLIVGFVRSVGCAESVIFVRLRWLRRSVGSVGCTSSVRSILLGRGRIFWVGHVVFSFFFFYQRSFDGCLLYTSPSPRD